MPKKSNRSEAKRRVKKIEKLASKKAQKPAKKIVKKVKKALKKPVPKKAVKKTIPKKIAPKKVVSKKIEVKKSAPEPKKMPTPKPAPEPKKEAPPQQELPLDKIFDDETSRGAEQQAELAKIETSQEPLPIQTIDPNKREISNEMESCYLDYAMSVIVSRALPDVRDGMKPVHRRILYAMHEMGLRHTTPFRKSASVVGEVLGKYHPHGDASVYDALIRMAQDFAMRYPTVHGQGNMGCFTGDTKVKLTDGRSLSFIELIQEAKKGKRNYTYTFNRETQKIEIAEIKNPRLTKKNQEIIKVILDNGEEIKCTPNHRFMLKGKTYKEAKDLHPGESLMPLYTKLCNRKEDINLKDYEMILQPLLNEWDFAHRLADEWNIKNKIYERSAGKIRHHVDFNKLNNNPDNIKRIQWKDHWKYHKEIASSRHKNDPQYVKKLAEGRNKFWTDEKNRIFWAFLTAERNKIMWRNPKYRKRWIEAKKKMWEDIEYKEFMRKIASKNLKNLWQKKDFQKMIVKLKSDELKKKWQDKQYRAYWQEKMKEISLKIWSNPQHREYISKIMKEKTSGPAWKERQSEIAKKLWQDEKYRAKFHSAHFEEMAKEMWENPKNQELHRKKAAQQWKDPQFRQKITKALKTLAKKRFEENPDFMKDLTEKARVSLCKKWQNPIYKERVIKSKILGYVYRLLKKYPQLTPEIYETERANNCIPGFSKAMNYFGNFSKLIEHAQRYNHSVVSIEHLQKKEDVYDLTIETTHNFSLGAGIFVHNSIDGDAAAAMRYTEVKLDKLSEEILSDIEKDTVDWQANYDGRFKEPKVLPSKIPQLLLNGSSGIAVGMATSIAPHNLSETIDGLMYLTDNPDATIDDLMGFIKGPDFPTGGMIYDINAIKTAYSTGRGGIVMRAKASIEEKKGGRFEIIVTEIPYQVNKSSLVEKIAELVHEKKIQGISDIRDESNQREGIRVVIELKKDSYPRKILNQLYKLTPLQSTFNMNMIALADGIQPKLFDLKQILETFIEHRKVVITRRTKYEARLAKERAHILEGLVKALDNIDEVIETIRKSDTKEDAHVALVKKFKLTDIQTDAILEMKLQTLAGLERSKIIAEYKEKLALIEELEDILKNPKKILNIMKRELVETKEKFGDERKTEIIPTAIDAISVKDTIPNEPMVVMLTQANYIKRMPPTSFRIQKRGGKGVIGMTAKEEDEIKLICYGKNHEEIMFFTNSGRVYKLSIYEIPQAMRIAKGTPIVNLLNLKDGEYVTAILNCGERFKGEALVMATKKGTVKKTLATGFANVRKSGLIAIKIREGDSLEWVREVSPNQEIMVITREGKSIKFKEADARSMGRATSGVRGIRLKPGDHVVEMDVINRPQTAELLVIMENGLGKFSSVKEYRLQTRGGTGVKTANITPKTGKIVGAKIVDDTTEDDLLIISKEGQTIRIGVRNIPVQGRATQGVYLMRMNAQDKVASISIIPEDEQKEQVAQEVKKEKQAELIPAPEVKIVKK